MSEELKPKLLPCPFCGFDDQLYPCYDFPGNGPCKSIDCLHCGIDFVPREGMDVIKAWNKRASQARLSEAVRVLEELGTAISIYRLGVKDTVPKIAVGYNGDAATIKALMANNEILDTSISKAAMFLATLGEENVR